MIGSSIAEKTLLTLCSTCELNKTKNAAIVCKNCPPVELINKEEMDDVAGEV